MTFLGNPLSSGEAVCISPQASAKSQREEGQRVSQQRLVQSFHHRFIAARANNRHNRAGLAPIQSNSLSMSVPQLFHAALQSVRLLLSAANIDAAAASSSCCCCLCSPWLSQSITTSSTLHPCCEKSGTTGKQQQQQQHSSSHTSFARQSNQTQNAA